VGKLYYVFENTMCFCGREVVGKKGEKRYLGWGRRYPQVIKGAGETLSPTLWG